MALPERVVAEVKRLFITLGAQRNAGRMTFPRRSIHTEISPLRFASVEMTKGRAALPERVVAEVKRLFITLGAQRNSGRDDKGRGVAQVGAVAGGKKQRVPPLRKLNWTSLNG